MKQFMLIAITLLLTACSEGPTDTLVPGFFFIDAEPVFYRGTVGQPAGDTITVTVTDHVSKPVRGVNVRFTANDSTGSIRALSAVTDANGKVRAIWTFGHKAGYQDASVEVAGQRHTFAAEVQPAAANTVVLTPPPGPRLAGDVYQAAIVARDVYNNEILLQPRTNGRPVAWSVSDPSMARVDSAGNVRMLKAGSATVTAEVQGKRGSVTVDAFAAAEMAIGHSYRCMLLADQRIACGGVDNSRGQFGIGTYDYGGPWYMPSNLRFERLVASHSTTCAVSTSGQLMCWGFHPNAGSFPNPTASPSALRLRLLSGGLYQICGISEANDVYCWLENTKGTGGFEPLPVLTGRGAIAVSASMGSEACAVVTSGDTYCWTDRQPVTRVETALRFQTIAVGGQHRCAIDREGAAYCWGIDLDGELGNGPGAPETCGANLCSSAPLAVTGGHRFTTIAAGDHSTCALDLTGAAWCWGSGRDVPTAVPGGDRFRNIVANNFIYCGVTLGGEALCWGASGTPGSPGTPVTRP